MSQPEQQNKTHPASSLKVSARNIEPIVKLWVYYGLSDQEQIEICWSPQMWSVLPGPVLTLSNTVEDYQRFIKYAKTAVDVVLFARTQHGVERATARIAYQFVAPDQMAVKITHTAAIVTSVINE